MFLALLPLIIRAESIPCGRNSALTCEYISEDRVLKIEGTGDELNELPTAISNEDIHRINITNNGTEDIVFSLDEIRFSLDVISFQGQGTTVFKPQSWYSMIFEVYDDSLRFEWYPTDENDPRYSLSIHPINAFPQTASYPNIFISLDIYDGQSEMNTGMFRNWDKLETVDFYSQSITSLPEYTFANCTSLHSIELNQINSIGAHCFENCTSLYSVNVNVIITTVSEYGFYQCKDLQNLQEPRIKGPLEIHYEKYAFAYTSMCAEWFDHSYICGENCFYGVYINSFQCTSTIQAYNNDLGFIMSESTDVTIVIIADMNQPFALKLPHISELYLQCYGNYYVCENAFSQFTYIKSLSILCEGMPQFSTIFGKCNKLTLFFFASLYHLEFTAPLFKECYSLQQIGDPLGTFDDGLLPPGSSPSQLTLFNL